MRRTLIIVGMVINVVVPGLGTLLMGKWKSGVIQLGLIMAIWLLGWATFGLAAGLLFPLHGLVEIWALGSGVVALVQNPKRELGRGSI